MNNFSTINMSVFFPALNEEKNIKSTIEEAEKILKNLSLKGYEIIVVNDGSVDKTGEVVEELAKKSEKLRLINHPTNLGYGHALKTGFSNAKYPWVAFTDSDRQFDFSEITKFLEKTDEADLILGYRLKRADSLLRRIYTFGWKTLALILLGLTVKDYSCGFKMIKKKVYESVLPLEAGEKVTQIEFLVKAKRLGFKFAEVGVNHYPRKFGTPTGAKIKVVIRSVVDIFKLWLKLR
jgi:glycosyltransferase involved in cell wall biosynthesis